MMKNEKMKCKKFSSAFNTYVVEKLKKLKVNGQSDKMPTMPITLSDSSYSDLKLKESSLMSASETAATPQKTAEIPKSSPVSTPSVDTNRQTRHPATAGGQPTVPHRRTAMDFRFGRPIGEGSFSTVYMAEDIHTRKEYAIKVCNKAHIIKERKADYIRREREVLNTLSTCDGFVSLYCTFQDATNLYFVLSLAKKGDMLPAINRVGSFTLSCARHYAAELVLALEKMHCKGVIHRDLKPENILMDEKMHTLLTDFGSSKMLGLPNGLELLTNADAPSEAESELCQPENNRTERRRKNSFVGTAQYVSPEVLQNQPTGRATDLWALGAIIYQMISGLPPFRGATEYIIFQKVLKREIAFPTGFDETAADFVSQLLQLNPNERLGMTDTEKTYDSLRSHPFFEGIDWEEMRNVDPPAINPYLPGLENEDLQQSNYRVPEHIEPGLDENRITRLELGLEMFSGARSTDSTPTSTVSSTHSSKRNIFDISEEEMKSRLEQQSQTNKWHPFADGELIVKQGFVNKRKGLFARKRMLLLTTGPRLIYIDPFQMVKKGEIEWTSALRVEPKNFKIFFVHTPNRTYYLEDSEGHKAQEWCDAINDVRLVTYGSK